jgi:hypothetical protein
MMRTARVAPKSSSILKKVAGALLLLASLAFLAGCQGVSAANSSEKVGTIALPDGSVDFGNVTPGNTKTLTISATNSGTATVNISSFAISTKYFSMTSPTLPVAVPPGQSASLSLMFSPNGTGNFNAVLTIGSDASDTQTSVTLSGNGSTSAPGALSTNPGSEAFGSVINGTKQSKTVTLSNTGSSTVNVSQVSVSGAGFQVSGITTPVAISASQSTTFTVSFNPQTAGSATGLVTITSDASDSTTTMSLSGTGVVAGALGSNPTSMPFGSVQVGTNKTLSETVTNTGGSSVTISSVAASGTGFSVSGITTPVTLGAGQGATFSVKFTPQSAAPASGNVTVTSTASNPTLTIPISGTGTAAGALGSNPTSIPFGTVLVGSNQTVSETVTNTGGTSVTISSVAASGTGFSVTGITTPVTLAAGQGAPFSVKFTPQSPGSASGNVTVTSNGSNPTLTIPLSGSGSTAGALGSNPTSIPFGSVLVGSNQTVSETVTNTGGTSVTISSVAATGTGFSVSGITTPVTLAAGQGATFSVKFTPQSAGSASGNVAVTSNGSNPTLNISLSGTGTTSPGQLGANPSTLPIGSVVVGTSDTGSGSLTASGSSVTVTSVSSNNARFSVSGLNLPVTINAGQSVPFTVTFSPQTTGAANATLTFTSNASPTTTQESVTGTGTPAATHTVSLSWDASSSTDVAGYNVYRAPFASACGSFQLINSGLNASTVYTDSAVTNGSSYCYATTAVDSGNQESGYSNIVSNVQIPIS